MINPKRPTPGDRCRHINGREGLLQSIDSDDDAYIILTTVLWDGETEPERLSIGFVERVGLPGVEKRVERTIALSASEANMAKLRGIDP